MVGHASKIKSGGPSPWVVLFFLSRCSSPFGPLEKKYLLSAVKVILSVVKVIRVKGR